MRTNRLAILAAAALLSTAAGCARESSAREVATSNLVTVTARDFAFAAPSEIPAGLTTLRLENLGPEMHHAQLVRLEDGHTLDELIARARAGDVAPEWAVLVGGPNVPAPGQTSEVTVDLEAGSYAIVCIIPSADGVMHLMKGMVKPLTVVPAAARRAPSTPAEVRMVLTDYAFEIEPEIAAGRRTIRVENAAAQPHEVIVARLQPGRTAEELVAWLHAMEGPPPAIPLGGTTLLSTGRSNDMTLDFEPGEYALLCLVPDAGDGRPHVAHGMVRTLTVR